MGAWHAPRAVGVGDSRRPKLTRWSMQLTKEKLKELLPVMQSWIAGKALQWRSGVDTPWQDLDMSLFPAWGTGEFRVRPNPIYMYVVIAANGTPLGTYSDKTEVIRILGTNPGSNAYTYREAPLNDQIVVN